MNAMIIKEIRSNSAIDLIEQVKSIQGVFTLTGAKIVNFDYRELELIKRELQTENRSIAIPFYTFNKLCAVIGLYLDKNNVLQWSDSFEDVSYQ